ncbi:PorT family protein [Bizionia argentinensis JUB59]|uniref:PorT family protein n=1 Tax=Bizionia argentinensis JUB59 TaxID=1046627 RepID=G2ECC6_9FLAO|nr:porin family protein [Bizionia argentinensis]EGV43900.1 PorT family protein [Bizionia argentinensis JUB59]
MKKVFLVAAITVFAISNSNAQSDSKAVQFGVKGGVNFSTITSDDFDDADSRTSFNVGVLAEIPLTERISIQPEALYSGQGFTSKVLNQDVDYNLNYIQVPVLVKVYLIEGLSVEAGPQFGFKIHEEIKVDSDAIGGNTTIDPDDSAIKDFDTSVAFGAAYKFDNGFFINGRYNMGLTNIFKDDTVIENIDAKNAVWQIGAGFMF